MAILRMYDKQGTILSATTSPANAGGLCWLGADVYAVVGETRITQICFDGGSAAFGKRLILAGPAGTVFKSAEISRRQTFDTEGDLVFEPDGHQIFVTSDTEIGGVAHHQLSVYDIELGTLAWTHDFGASGGNGGITTNGMNWFTGLTEAAGGAIRLLAFETDGFMVNIPYRSTESVLNVDMCHDGLHLWSLEGTTVKQYEPSPVAPFFRQVSSFSATGTRVLGITTNGHNLIVLSET